MPESGGGRSARRLRRARVQGGTCSLKTCNAIRSQGQEHYESYSGEDVSETALILIALQTLPDKVWAKADLKVPYDWENDKVPASFELHLGKSFTPAFAAYVDLQAGIGGNRPYDWATGVGLRFSY